MKKALLVTVGLFLAVPGLLGSCGGTPKPPVARVAQLEQLVTQGMTVPEVEGLMKPELKAKARLYPALRVAQSGGGWTVTPKEGGFAQGEAPPFRVYILPPDAQGIQYLAIFFKEDNVMGKSWLDNRLISLIESMLEGQGFPGISRQPTTPVPTK